MAAKAEKAETPKVEITKEALDALIARVEKAEADAAHAKSVTETLKAVQPKFEKRKTEQDLFLEYYSKHKVVDNLDPNGERPFKYGDLVRLKPGTPKFQALEKHFEKIVEKRPEDEEAQTILASFKNQTGPIGEVWKFLGTKRGTKDPKFQVRFPGGVGGYGGRDGCRASELVMVSQA